MNKSFVFWYEDDIKFSRDLLCDALKDIRAKGKIEDIVHSKAAGIGWAFIYWEPNDAPKSNEIRLDWVHIMPFRGSCQRVSDA